MAVTIAQSNVLSEMQTEASELISIKARMNSLVLMYTSESIATLTDADIQSLAEFAHVTAMELQTAGAALAAINTALGDFSQNSNVAKLLKIVKAVPK
jgi:hypothetical protein